MGKKKDKKKRKKDKSVEVAPEFLETPEPEPVPYVETREPHEYTIRRPLMSGHCAFPATANPQGSHDRCSANGGGQRGNPDKEFQPCPCPCHYGETYECGGCGRPIREAPYWPFGPDGDVRYTHVDPKTGRATGEECAE